MTDTSSRELAELVENMSGIVVPEHDLERLGILALERAAATGRRDVGDYFALLRRDAGSDEWPVLLSRITNKESYLFRGGAQFEALESTILPELADRRRDHHLNVWCAGCARGEEAATLAIVLADSSVVGDWSWRILATDVDSAALAEAREGLFGRRAVAKVSEDALDRHFTPRGDRFELDSALRARIHYRPVNLAARPLEVRDGPFDVIFLRNVLIYFRPEVQSKVVSAVEGELAADGSLFLGPSESLLSLGSGLGARDLGSCFCYRRMPVDGRSAGLVARNTDSEEAPPPAAPSGARQFPRLDEERVEDRLEAVVDALDMGEDVRAAEIIESLLSRFPESAILHALKGLVHDRCGEAETAVQAYRAALYLAPGMVETRFLLARSLTDLGRTRRASHEYRAVLASLGASSERTPSVFARLGLPSFDAMGDACRDALRAPEGKPW